MTDGLIQTTMAKYIDRALSGQHGLKPADSFIISAIQHDLVMAIGLEILSIYEQNPEIPGSDLKLIRKALIGEGPE